MRISVTVLLCLALALVATVASALGAGLSASQCTRVSQLDTKAKEARSKADLLRRLEIRGSPWGVDGYVLLKSHELAKLTKRVKRLAARSPVDAKTRRATNRAHAESAALARLYDQQNEAIGRFGKTQDVREILLAQNRARDIWVKRVAKAVRNAERQVTRVYVHRC